MDAETTDSQTPKPAEPTDQSSPKADPVPEDPADEASPRDPNATQPPQAGVPEPASGTSASPRSPTPGEPTSQDAEEAPTLDPKLLEGTTKAEVRPRVAPPPAPVEDSLADPGLHQEGRLPGNPTRFQLTARALFASMGAGGLGGGRIGGTRVDVGQTWNVMGYAVSLTALGGRVQLDQDQELLALLGGGPSLTLGRFAMIGRGVADLRIGYDFLYAPGRGGSWAPHGPRVSIDMALLTSGRRFWQGFGVSAGYQAFVHSFADRMPYVGMLSAGVVYWFG